MNEVRLTPAQAEVLEKRLFDGGLIAPVGVGCWLSNSIRKIIHKLTAKPGEHEFCGARIDGIPCFYWRYYVRKAVAGLGPNSYEIFPGDGTLRCRHPDAKKSYCPIDRWGEKGGDANAR